MPGGGHKPNIKASAIVFGLIVLTAIVYVNEAAMIPRVSGGVGERRRATLDR
jgi:hypothetical protein